MNRHLSIFLVLVFLLSLTSSVAEDSSLDVANELSAMDDVVIDDIDIEVIPEEIGDLEIFLGDGMGEVLAPEDAVTPEGTAAPEVETVDPVEPTNASKETTVPKELILGKGETYDFGIKDATITSNKKSVVSANNKKSIIKAEKTGSAKVTVKSGGKKLGICKVTVRKTPDKVTLSQKKLTLSATDTYTLKVTLPKKTASNKLTWKSSNKKVATVDKNGVVKALKKGTTKITVTTFNKKSATCKITVNNDPLSVSFPMESITIGKGESVTIKPVVNEGAKPKYTWKSKKKSIATVDKNGKITGKKAGSSTTITVKTQNDKTAKLKVSVKAAPTKVTLSDATVEVGSTVQLKAKLSSKSASYKLTWKSSNKKVATVDKNGLVKGIEAGTATITVSTFNKQKATCTVTVTKKEEPTPTPTVMPTEAPTEVPTEAPTEAPTESPTEAPTEAPMTTPTTAPTESAPTDPIVGTINSIIIKFGDTVAGDDVVVLPDEAVTASWFAEGGVVSYYYQVLDDAGTVVSSQDAVASTMYEIAAGAIVAGQVYTLRVGAMPINGIADDIVWKSASFKRNAAPVVGTTSDFTIVNGVVTAYNGAGGAIEIPGTDGNGNAVVAIGDEAFKANATITSVSIPASVTTVGESAFEECSSLESVMISNGVSAIGKAAFKNCEKLKSMSTFGE